MASGVVAGVVCGGLRVAILGIPAVTILLESGTKPQVLANSL
jgi:hypothetical protein